MVGAEYHNMECIQRECEECGVQLLDTYFDGLINASINETVSWNYWTSVEYCHPGKKSSQRKTLLQTTTSVTELINAIKRDCSTLSSHLLNASWQKNCFDALSKHVPVNSVVMHLYFSENYATFFQQEISSAHWMKNLITVHPIVVYYNCPECLESAHPVMDVLVFLSDDTQHDHHAVQNFIQTAVRFLKEERVVLFNVMYEFTDGCSSQYKSRGPLVDISFGNSDFGVKRERFFFGSCHGKGPCDAAGGVVKTAARMAVIRGQAIITDAKGMYSCMKTKHTRKSKLLDTCNHSRREFFLVENISRDRPERGIKTSVKGTRKLHAVRGMTPGVICTRNLGCVCQSCLIGEDNCINDAYTAAWKVQPLNLQIPQVQRTWQQGRGAQQGPRGARRGKRDAGRGGGRGNRGAGRGQRGAGRGHRGVGQGHKGTGRGRQNNFDYNNAESTDNDESYQNSDTCSSSDSSEEEVTHGRIDDTGSDSDGDVSAEVSDVCSDRNSNCEEKKIVNIEFEDQETMKQLIGFDEEVGEVEDTEVRDPNSDESHESTINIEWVDWTQDLKHDHSFQEMINSNLVTNIIDSISLEYDPYDDGKPFQSDLHPVSQTDSGQSSDDLPQSSQVPANPSLEYDPYDDGKQFQYELHPVPQIDSGQSSDDLPQSSQVPENPRWSKVLIFTQRRLLMDCGYSITRE